MRVFEGQTIKESNFTITDDYSQGTMFTEDGIGVGNSVIINEEQMLKNVNKSQILDGIVPSDNLFGNNKAIKSILRWKQGLVDICLLRNNY